LFFLIIKKKKAPAGLFYFENIFIHIAMLLGSSFAAYLRDNIQKLHLSSLLCLRLTSKTPTEAFADSP
jgi:hypothetical protein